MKILTPSNQGSPALGVVLAIVGCVFLAWLAYMSTR
jgi:threonine/homoserine/homoserine lactone efflux protein